MEVARTERATRRGDRIGDGIKTKPLSHAALQLGAHDHCTRWRVARDLVGVVGWHARVVQDQRVGFLDGLVSLDDGGVEVEIPSLGVEVPDGGEGLVVG